MRIARRRAGSAVLRVAGAPLLRALAASWRVEELGRERVERTPEGALISLWHGRMLVGMDHFGRRGWSVLVSPSGDGDLSEQLLQRFGYCVIRGSRSRGGARALRAMLEALDGGGKVIVTPDGPRGPRHTLNPGLAWMARATGAPILPLGMSCDSAWRLRSWDRFTIPRPRARVAFTWGEPLCVGRAGGEGALREATRELGERMLALERRGFEHLGAEPDW